MATGAPPPAYANVDNGEGGVPPSYNAQANAAPPSYNPSAPVSNPSAPSQPAANIKYVDQNGNPVAPPQAANIQYVDQNGNPVNPPPSANIKYVDQNGNPVNPPQAANIKYVDQKGNPVAAPVQQPMQQPAVKYVDQYGNPVAAPVQQPQPVANIKYVDQYGNPVAAPTTTPTAMQQPQAANIKYVDQYGNPVAAPTTGVQVQQPAANIKYVDQYGNPVAAPTTATTTPGPGAVVAAGANNKANPMMRSVKQQRTASAVLGGIAVLILFIGLCVDSLARHTSYLAYYDAVYTCGWTEYRMRCNNDYSYSYGSSCTDNELSYSDLCDLYDGLDYDGPTWCGTQTAAALSLVTMLFGTILCLVAVVLVQPWCKVNPCCCKSNAQCGCARVSFLFSMFLGILTLIIWFAGDDICISEDSEMGIGGSMVCQIIGLIFVVISAALARA